MTNQADHFPLTLTLAFQQPVPQKTAGVTEVISDGTVMPDDASVITERLP
jgi:hypothetical protein